MDQPNFSDGQFTGQPQDNNQKATSTDRPLGIQTMPVVPPSSRKTTTGKSRFKKVILVIVVLLVIAGGSAGAAYYLKIWPFVDEGALKQAALIEAFDKLLAMETVQYKSDIAVKVENRDPAVKSLDEFMPPDQTESESSADSFLSSTGMLSGLIPSDFQVQLHMEGEGSATAQAAAGDVRLALSGTATFEDTTFTADVEFMKIGDMFYARLNQFPSIFSDIGDIKGQWIRVAPDDLEQFASFGYDISSLSQIYDQQHSEVSREFSKNVYRIVREEGLFEVDYSAADGIVSGVEHYMYGLSLNATALGPFYRRMWSEMMKLYTESNTAVPLDDEAPEELLEVFESEEFIRVIDFLNANSEIRVAVNKETGYMDHMAFTFRVAPGFDSVEQVKQQVVITSSVDYSNINQPVQLVAPADYIGVEEAMVALTGESFEVLQFKAQQNNIRLIRSALQSYKAHSGSYPELLSDLLKKRSEVLYDPSAEAGGFTGFAEPSDLMMQVPFIARLFKDVYTAEDFIYASTGDTYTVRYTIELPSTLNNTLIYDVIGFVNGINTATDELVSREAAQALLIDSDGDGLPNVVEEYYGSSNQSDDSDADGFTDLEEVQNGYHPAGARALETHERWSASEGLTETSLYALQQLEEARYKAKIAAAKGYMNSLLPGMVLCHDSGDLIVNGLGGKCSGAEIPQVGEPICTDESFGVDWPELPDIFIYGTCNAVTAESYLDSTFYYSATDGNCLITCSEAGCTYDGC